MISVKISLWKAGRMATSELNDTSERSISIRRRQQKINKRQLREILRDTTWLWGWDGAGDTAHMEQWDGCWKKSFNFLSFLWWLPQSLLLENNNSFKWKRRDCNKYIPSIIYLTSVPGDPFAFLNFVSSSRCRSVFGPLQMCPKSESSWCQCWFYWWVGSTSFWLKGAKQVL